MSNSKFSLPLKAIQFAAIAEELFEWAEQLKKCEAVAKTQPDEILAVHNWPSAVLGLDAVRKFVDKAKKSRTSAQLGKPIPIGDPTDGAKRIKKKKPSVDEMEKIYEAKEAAIGKKKPTKKATKKKGQ